MAELKNLRFSLGVPGGTGFEMCILDGQVERFGDKVREAGMKQFGHVQKRVSGYTRKRMLKMELPCRKKRRRPHCLFFMYKCKCIKLFKDLCEF